MACCPERIRTGFGDYRCERIVSVRTIVFGQIFRERKYASRMASIASTVECILRHQYPERARYIKPGYWRILSALRDSFPERRLESSIASLSNDRSQKDRTLSIGGVKCLFV